MALGDHIVTGEDTLTARKFEEGTARGTYPVNTHNPNGKGAVPRGTPATFPFAVCRGSVSIIC